MKSSELTFANSKLQEIDFEILPNSKFSFLLGAFFLISTPIALILGITCWYCLLAFRFYLDWEFIAVLPIKLFRLSKAYFNNPLKIAKDTRSPILYLRSFNDDVIENSERLDGKTSEEILASILDKKGPVLAVGNPEENGNKTLFLGATRIYMGENWMFEVEKLMAVCQFVVIESNFSHNLLWELKTVRRIVSPEKVIISYLSTNEPDYHIHRFNKILSQIFSIHIPAYYTDICFLIFDNEWKPYAIPLEAGIKSQGISKIRDAIAPVLSHYPNMQVKKQSF